MRTVPRTPRARIGLFITLLVLLELVGTFGYHSLEGWTWIDSFYNTLLNVIAFGGIGDLAPRSVTGRLFTVSLKFLSLVFWGGILYNAMQTVIAQRVDQVTSQKLRALNLGPLNVFISYRRSDAAGHAGRLYDRLISHFGVEHVFMDIDTIKPSDNFREAIENAVNSCHILVAVIGKQWAHAAGGTSRRLDDPADFVRLEIRTALSRGIRVLPVLVQGAVMPNEKDLPDDLTGLVQRQALELSDVRWPHDIDQMLKVIEGVAIDKQTLDKKS